MSAPTERLRHDGDRPPLRIPDHTLLRVIGRGSYGEVWEARNVMGTPRAVKIVRRDDFESARPFDREFEGIQRYEPVSRTHAGLVQVLHVGEDRAGGYFYYVMELADNADPGAVLYRPRTLRGEIQSRGRLPVVECIEMGITLASALGHLHRCGLVHRDVKPSNIILVDGMVKLADVGLVAKLSDSRSLVGTEGYYAPEGTGKPRSDVYSLGKVLYECITGMERTSFPDVPDDWDGGPESRPAFEFMEIVLRAAEPNPDRRYADTDEMLADLALLKAGKSLRYLRRVETRLKRTLQVLAIAAVAIAAVGGAWFYEMRRADQIAAAEQRTARAQEETQRLLGESLVAGARAERLSRLAGARAKALEAVQRGLAAGASPLELRTQAASALALIDAGEIRPDRGLRAPGQWVAWSPDAGFAVVADPGSGMTRVIDRSTQRETASFTAGPGVLEMAVAPRAEHVAFVFHDGRVALWEARSGRRHWESAPCPVPCRPSFSGDGAWVIYAAADGLTARACGAGEAVVLVPGAPGYRGLSLAPNGQWIASLLVPSGERDGRPTKDLGLRIYTGLPGRLPSAAETGRVKAHDINSDIRLEGMSISHDSRYVAAAVSEDRLRVWEVPGMSQIVWLRGHQRSVRGTAFHPLDSNIVASTSWDGTTRLWDMTTRREILVIPAGGEEIVMSPDQGEILLRSWDRQGLLAAPFSRRSALRVFRIPPFTPLGLFASVDFNGDGRLLAAAGDAGVIVWDAASGEYFTAEPPGRPMDWRNGIFDPGNDALYFSGPKGLFRRSFAMDETGGLRFGPKETVLNGFASFLGWAGDRLAISGRHDDQGRPGVGLRAADGSMPLLLPPQSPDQLATSPDGRWLAVARYPGGGGTVWDLHAQPPVARDVETPTRANFGFSADSRVLIIGTEKAVEFVNPAAPAQQLAAPLTRTNCQEIPSHSAASAAAGLVAVSTGPTEITLCDGSTFAPVLRLDSPLTPFDCALAFSPDGRSLALAGGTSRVMVWDLGWIHEELTRLGLGWSADHRRP